MKGRIYLTGFALAFNLTWYIVERSKQRIFSSSEDLNEEQKAKIKGELAWLKGASSSIFFSDRMAEAMARKFLLPERATRRYLKELMTGIKDEGMDVIDLFKVHEEHAMYKRLGLSTQDTDHMKRKICSEIRENPRKFLDDIITIFSEILKLTDSKSKAKISKGIISDIYQENQIDADKFFWCIIDLISDDLIKIESLTDNDMDIFVNPHVSGKIKCSEVPTFMEKYLQVEEVEDIKRKIKSLVKNNG